MSRNGRPIVYLAALAGTVLAVFGSGELVWALVQFVRLPLEADAGWRGALLSSLAALAVGLLLAALARWRAGRLAASDPVGEMNALGRVLLRQAAQVAGAVVVLLGVGVLAEKVVLVALGESADLRLPCWPRLLAYAPAAAILWLGAARGLRSDRAAGGESPRTGAIRRIVSYGIAAAALAAFWSGLTVFAWLILHVLLGAQAGDLMLPAIWPRRFAQATALILVGAPVWWMYWWPQQVRARAPGQDGHAERSSPIRRVYLVAIVLCGAAVIVFMLGFGGFLALNWRALRASEGGAAAAVAGAAAAAAVAGLWAIAHTLTLRGDVRVADSQLAADAQAGGGSSPAFPEGEDQVEAVVIDGLDGGIGAALVDALRRQLPEIAVRPVGLGETARLALGGAPGAPGDALGRAAIIIGPADILTPGAMGGEVSAELVASLRASRARILLLPPRDPAHRWVSAPEWPLERWLEEAVVEVQEALRLGVPLSLA